VGDDEGPLLREVVVQVGDDLDGHISFAGSWKKKTKEIRLGLLG
jgi:hypothetical protein